MDEGALVVLVRALIVGGAEAAELPIEAAVARVQERIREAAEELGDALLPDEVTLLDWVVRGTLAPRTLTRDHLRPLRDRGWNDTALHDVVHVVACFSYMNRLADMLGVRQAGEANLRLAVRLFGAGAVAAHPGWAARDPRA